MNKNKITKFLTLALVMALAVGSFAYFTDREVLSGDDAYKFTLDDKGIDIRPVDPGAEDPDPETPVPDDYDPGEEIEKIWDANNEGSIEDKDIYPGEKVDMDFDFYNASDAAVDIRETIVLTVTDYDDSAMPLSATPEYRMFKDAVEDAFGALDGQDPIVVETVTGNQVLYKIAPFALDGQNENIDGKAGFNTRAKMSYTLVLNKLAGNAFQASNCKIDYIVEAKQHADGGADKGWSEVATINKTIGNINTNVVPNSLEN